MLWNSNEIGGVIDCRRDYAISLVRTVLWYVNIIVVVARNIEKRWGAHYYNES